MSANISRVRCVVRGACGEGSKSQTMQLIDKNVSEAILRTVKASGKVEYIPANRGRRFSGRGELRTEVRGEACGEVRGEACGEVRGNGTKFSKKPVKKAAFRIRANYEKEKTPEQITAQIFAEGQTRSPRANTTPRWAWEPANNRAWQDSNCSIIQELDGVFDDWAEELAM